MSGKLTLSKNFSMPAIDYAGQGNAILGIRDAGKTYTAMKAAEELLDNNIPIIVYDPVGVWKNLKIGIGKNKGYPIVTAGGSDCDLKLTVTNAVDIVRAAMKENVSLVIDLYSPELINKSTWIRIVQETVDLLMYENEPFGMRHIFIEEAAEFIPQRLQPQHYKVYASIERLARMGRNARLGYTLINQRAEEVNKAILEIAAFSLLHKQVGKNSLKSIQTWLELRQLENTKDIIKTLPSLKRGECWAIGMTDQPQLIHVAEKKTFHPDPKRLIETVQDVKKVVDVTTWVEKLNKRLEKPVEKKENKKISSPVKDDSKYITQISDLQNQLKLKDAFIVQQSDYLKKLYKQINVVRHAFELEPLPFFKPDSVNNIKENVVVSPSRNFVGHNKKFADLVYQKVKDNASSNGSVTGGAMRMLKAAAMFHPKPISKTRMAALARLSYTSGSFGTYLSTLKREDLIINDGNNHYLITDKGLEHAGDVEALPTDPQVLIELWCENVGNQSGAARMLRVLGERYPAWLTKSALGEAVEMSHTSGSFGTYLSTLKRNGLIKIDSGVIKAADELFN